MPTYEYRCSACGHAFEKFQSMSAAPVKTCPKCGEDRAQRQISGGAGFIFKGGGFYETDYRSEAYKKSAEADKPPTGDVKPADAKGGDAKPAETKAADAKPTDAKPAAKAEPAAAPPVSKPELSTSKPPTPPPVGG